MIFQETKHNNNDDIKSHTGSVIVIGNEIIDTFQFYYVEYKLS